MMGVAMILALRFHRYTAWALMAMFVIQFPLTSAHGRFILAGCYGAVTAVALLVNRRHLWGTLCGPVHRCSKNPRRTIRLTPPPSPRRCAPHWIPLSSTGVRPMCSAKPKPRYGVAGLVAAVTLILAACTSAPPSHRQTSVSPLPLRPVREIPLPGDNSRFDYASLDAGPGLLFIAHLGANEVVEVDVHEGRVVRTIPDLSQVHGVLVAGSLNRVYATATAANEVVVIDEHTGEVLGHAATGAYPDGLAYDPRRNAIWTSNETAGTETIVDAATLQPRGSLELGGEVGNVGYDPDSDRMLVAVQADNDLAVVDPAAMTIVRKVALPGCDHPHGLAVDGPDRLVFVACDHNAALITVDQTTWVVSGSNPVGDDPDVLAYDGAAHRLYVAAESGTLTTLDLHDRALAVTGSDHLVDGAHVVAVDPNTHRSYYPVPTGADGHPALLEREPS
jgi:DNA-binding beta-propeller fold protein YncE